MQQSASYTTTPYLIRAMSNLHAGSGDTTYGVIDKMVQRSLDGIPVIHASGIKGAFRERMAYEMTDNHKDPNICYIFGSPTSSSTDDEDNLQPGNYNFYDARLLSLPVRSSHRPFFRATCPSVLMELEESLDFFKVEDPALTGLRQELKTFSALSPPEEIPWIFETLTGKVYLEDYEAQKYTGAAPVEIPKILGNHLALFHDDTFKTLCQFLPVIARNCLDNGISRNLWYEEVAPRESRFYFLVSQPLDQRQFITLDTYLDTLDHVLQIGGNASVGYGCCEVKQLVQYLSTPNPKQS